MHDYTRIAVVRDGAVDWLTLNRPESLNALDGKMAWELSDYFGRLQSDDTRRIVVMRGAGRAFCSGLDLQWFDGDDDMRLEREAAMGSLLTGIILKMRSCPQAIVALIHGPACGGGFNLALASDIRIAGESAKMNVAFVKLGLSGCELGTSFFLPRMVGSSVAAELMMTGRFIHAERALTTGLVSQVVDDQKLEDTARELVAELLAASPMGLRKTKEVMAVGAEGDDLAAIIRLEAEAQQQCMSSGHFAESIGAFTERAD
ncbi:MAG: enoyl-CoA hydratase/isomerase family protein [Sphingomonas sp.]|uniref:enoyl-CoA hydratase/isomerase family protein n=1 Tax=Sphingomonas sp. TaxID=28214 RepID=UPI003F808FEF